MPIGPFRTYTQPVNLRDLDRFDAGDEVTPETLVEKRLIKNTSIDVKLLGVGEVTKKLTVRVHAISASAREKIEASRRHRRAPARAEGEEGAAPQGEARRRRRVRRGRGRRAARGDRGERGRSRRSRKEPRTRCPGSPTCGVYPSCAAACSSRPRMLAVYRLGSWIPAPGVDQTALKPFFGHGAGSGGVFQLLNLFSGSALSRFSLFALGIMPYVTASIIFQVHGGRRPVARAAAEGGRGGLREDHAVHPLPHRRSRRRAVDRLRVPVQAANVLPNVNSRPAADHHPHAHGRHDDADVDRRADHEARHRQRDLDHHLRLDPRVRPGGDQRLDQRRNDGAPLLPARRARDRRLGRLRDGGTAADPDPVRAAPARQPADDRRRDLHAAQHRAWPASSRSSSPRRSSPSRRRSAASRSRWSNWIHDQLRLHELEVPARRGDPDHHDDLLLHLGRVQPGRAGRQPAQVQRLHPGHPAGAADRGVLRPRPEPADLPGALFLAAVAVAPSVFISHFHFSQATYRALGGTSVLIVVGVALQTMRQMESQMVMRHYEGFLR